MKRLFIFTAIVLVSVAGFCLAQDNDKADKYAFPPLPQELKHADSLLAAGDSAKGLAELRAIVNSKAGDDVRARAQFNIAKYYDDQLLYKTGTNVEKIRYFKQNAYNEYKRLLDIAPKSAIKPWALLYMSFVLPNGESKIELYKQIIADYPNSEVGKNALSTMAQTLSLEGKNKESIAAYRQYIKGYPEDRYQCANALYQIGCMTGDILVFEDVIEQYSDQTEIVLQAYDRIAGIHGINGEFEDCIRVSYEAIERYKNHPSVPIRLIGIYNAYYEHGDLDKANKVKQRILAEYPESETAKEIRSWSQPKK